MAKNTKQTAAKPEMNVDLTKFLPEGFSLSDFDVVGGLRPICPPELNEGSPIVGWVVTLLDMPDREDGSKWQALLINLASTAKAKAGDDIVDVEPGQDVLIPVGGNLKNNADLLNAAVDPHKVVMGIFTVTGQQDVGKPSPMWTYDVRLAIKKAKTRDGAFALYNRPVATPAQIPTTFIPRGEVMGANGKPAQLVG